MRYLKIILTIAVIVSACGMASAQKGMQGVGVNLGIRYETNCLDYSMERGIIFGMDMKYQYNVNNYYRIEPFLSLGTRKDQKEFQIGMNNHIFLWKVRRCRPYFIAGLGFSWVKYTGELANGYDLRGYDFGYEYVRLVTESIRSGSFYWRSGFGADYRFTHKWSGQLELCMAGTVYGYQLVYPQLRIGFTYTF